MHQAKEFVILINEYEGLKVCCATHSVIFALSDRKSGTMSRVRPSDGDIEAFICPPHSPSISAGGWPCQTDLNNLNELRTPIKISDTRSETKTNDKDVNASKDVNSRIDCKSNSFDTECKKEQLSRTARALSREFVMENKRFIYMYIFIYICIHIDAVIKFVINKNNSLSF
jgi:hypothetical protein